MKIFYLCRTGHHTSLLAAALHLQLFNGSYGRNIDLFNLPGFDRIESKDIGRPFFVGRDRCEHDVFTIGVGRNSTVLAKTANDLLGIIEGWLGDWQIIDTEPVLSGWTKAGLQIKKLGLHKLAAWLFLLGTRVELNRLPKLLHEHGLDY